MDRAWAYATAIVNINTGKSYTVRQIKKMDREGLLTLINPPKTEKGDYDKGGQAELSRRTGILQPCKVVNFLRL